MKIAILGPSDSVDIVLRVLEKLEMPIQYINYSFKNYNNLKDLTIRAQEEADALLFTGTTPYNYISAQVAQSKPWEFLPRNSFSLVCALFRGVYEFNSLLYQISIDSYTEQEVMSVLSEMDIDSSKITVREARFSSEISGYEEYLFHFHRDNIQSGRSDICITGMSRVAQRLRDENIPVCHPFATSETIIQKIQKLYLTQNHEDTSYIKTSVIAIRLQFSQEHALFCKNSYQTYLMTVAASKVIYSFSQRINGALEIHEGSKYHIYLSRKDLDTEMLLPAKFSLMKELERCQNVKQVSIGIGSSSNINTAQYYAEISLGRAESIRSNCIFLMETEDITIGPVFVSPQNEKVSNILDYDLTKISELSGIRLETLFRIYEAMQMCGRDTITPYELAQICDFSRYAMNRIIIKLEAAGYLVVVGKKSVAGTGRPSRVIRLLLPR